MTCATEKEDLPKPSSHNANLQVGLAGTRSFFERSIELELRAVEQKGSVLGGRKCRVECPKKDSKICDLAPILLVFPPAAVEAVQIGCWWMEVS